jgi:serine/threonine protein kinase
MTEVSIHKTLDHPCIVKFEEFFEDYYHFYLVLELCTEEVGAF